MSVLRSSPPFLSPSKNSRSLLPPRSQSLPASLNRGRLGSHQLLKHSALFRLRCSSAIAIEEGPISSSSSLQDSMLYSRAFWVSKETIAWDVDARDGSYFLYGSKNANLSFENGEIQGYDVKFMLENSNGVLPDHVIEKFTHIQDYKPLRVSPALDVKSLLKYQLAVAVVDSGGQCTNITGLQLPGVLDELFSYNGPLGAIFSAEAIYLYLWAPTAQKVSALIYANPEDGSPLEIVELEESNGIWSTKGPVSWHGYYYVYEVCVYHPSTLQVEKCIANDPYARGLSADGRRTLIVDIASETLKPEAWDHLVDEKTNLSSFSDISIYELHVRDCSATDYTVPSVFRGGYLAFTIKDSAGMLHLKKLSTAGITHVHLLPTFQFGGVDDEKSKWKNVDFQMLKSFPPDSDEQQTCITAVQDADGYNWGYNPVLWGVPKGSYATNPSGPSRVIEFRKMVQALNRIGLRVVLDVVYNHLHASGPYDEYSVLDKIVPGYYLRRNLDGIIEHSTCTNNTASEHSMVERLIVDDLFHWAVNYKFVCLRTQMHACNQQPSTSGYQIAHVGIWLSASGRTLEGK